MNFTIGGADRQADFDPASSGTDSLIFTYEVKVIDEGLSNIGIEPVTSITGGTITATNGAPLVRQLSGERMGIIPLTTVQFTTNTGTAPDGRYAVGDTIEITLDANQDLTSAGSASLSIEIGGTAETANFDSFDTGNAVFTFGPLEHDSPGGTVEVTAINNGGDLQSASGDSLDASGFSGPFTGAPNVGEVLGKIECPTGNLTPATHVSCGKEAFGDGSEAIFVGHVPGSGDGDPATASGTDFFVARCDEGNSFTSGSCNGSVGSIFTWGPRPDDAPTATRTDGWQSNPKRSY